MTILFLDQFTEPGGAQQCLLDLLPAVIARGWKAVVAAPGEGPLAAKAIAAGACFHSIDCGPFHAGRKSIFDAVRFARQLPGLAREIAGLPADLIYVNGPRLLPAVPSCRPVIFHCHNYLGQAYTAWPARQALRRTNATVIGACRFVLKPLRQPKAHVVYNGVAEHRYPHEASECFRVGVIGRIAPQKGQAEFLQAAQHLRNCRFIICGAPLFGDEAYAREVRALAKGLPVEFLEWQDDVAAVLSRLDLLVVPSTVPEAMPRVILEAFAAGVPVLASPGGGISELIEHNCTGFMIESLETQIAELQGRPDLLASVAARARQSWRERFTLDEYQRRILSIVETAGASARR
jgi:glycosyltransferase involved in cell wall biosynthesis